MKSKWNIALCALAVSAALWTATPASAQNPFEGTWKMNLSQAKLSPKPNVFYLAQGWYHCESCNPVFSVKADGTDQPVTGQAYDTLSVKESGPDSLEFAGKKGGKLMFEQTRTVSKDGKMLTVKAKTHFPDSDQVVESESTAKLVGAKPLGVHAVSGNWQVVKIQESANGTTMTLKMNGDELTMTNPTGESFTAKLDGTSAPLKGTFSYDSVSVKKLDDSTIETTDSRGGQAIVVVKWTAKGKTLTEESTNKLTDRTNTYTWTKQ